MSKFEECVSTYQAEFDKLKVKYNADTLKAVTKACGPSIYNKDASKVSSSDEAELDRVRKNFIAKKLGVTDAAKTEAAMKHAIDTLGASNRNKYRAMFYYLVAEKLGKLGTFS